MKISAERFFTATGVVPVQDDLERCNCINQGEIGHTICGWSDLFEKPMFMLTSHQRSAEHEFRIKRDEYAKALLEPDKPRIHWSGKYQCYFTISDEKAAIDFVNALNYKRALALIDKPGNQS